MLFYVPEASFDDVCRGLLFLFVRFIDEVKYEQHHFLNDAEENGGGQYGLENVVVATLRVFFAVQVICFHKPPQLRQDTRQADPNQFRIGVRALKTGESAVQPLFDGMFVSVIQHSHPFPLFFGSSGKGRQD